PAARGSRGGRTLLLAVPYPLHHASLLHLHGSVHRTVPRVARRRAVRAESAARSGQWQRERGRPPTARLVSAVPCLGETLGSRVRPGNRGRPRNHLCRDCAGGRLAGRVPEGLGTATGASASLKIGPHRSILTASRCRSMPTFERDGVSLYYE